MLASLQAISDDVTRVGLDAADMRKAADVGCSVPGHGPSVQPGWKNASIFWPASGEARIS